MKKVVSVSLIFENCDSIEIPIKEIKGLYFEKDKIINMLVEDVIDNDIYTKVFYISFYNLEKIKKGNKLLIDYLKIKNITHFEILFSDRTKKYLAVPWKGKSKYINYSQKLKKREKFYFILIDEKFTIIDKIKDFIQCFKEKHRKFL